MIRAIEERNFHVNDGEAKRPPLQRVSNAVFHGAEILLRHDASVNLLVKGHAAAALAGTDLEDHITELAVTS